MRKVLLVLLAVALVLGLSSVSEAVLLTFDDIPGGSNQNGVADVVTYKGYNFSINIDWIDLVNSSWPYGAVSGDFGILNNNSGVGVITKSDGSDFTFGGIWAKRWATSPNSGGSDSLFGTLSGYNNGGSVWSVNTGLNGSYEFYGAQAGAIDELRLGFGNHFLADDLYLDEAGNGNEIPEPATMMLLGSGLFGLVGLKEKEVNLILLAFI